MRAKTRTVTRKMNLRLHDFTNSQTRSDSNIAEEKRKTPATISKNRLDEILCSEWPYLIKSVQLVQENLLTSAYRIFELGSLHKFYFKA